MSQFSKDIIVKLEKIKKYYYLKNGEPIKVLKGIDMEIYAGEFVSIMGPSGSGKSTLLNLLGALDKPTSGEYWLDGELVNDLDENKLAEVRSRKIGFIFQTFNLINELTALENVLLPQFYTAKEDVDRGMELLKLVGLEDRASHKPMELSGGQRQRVAIARALINDPAILLADEPTGNLDTKTGKMILDLIQDLHKSGRTIIMVTHDPYIAEVTDRSIYLEDGRIKPD